MKKSFLILIFIFLFIFSFSEEITISTTFYNTPLTEALNELGLQTGITILTDEYIAGIVTADFMDEPLDNVLSKILLPGGFTYRKIDETTYFVGLPDPRNKAFSLLADNELVTLNYIPVSEFVRILPESYLAYIKTVESKNAIMVYAPPEKIEDIKNIIEKVDIPENDIKLNIYILEIDKKYSDVFKGTVFDFNQPSSNDFLFNNTFLSFSIEDLFSAQIKMYESNSLAKVVSSQTSVIKSGEKLVMGINDNKNIIIYKENQISTREIKTGINIEVVPKLFKGKIEAEILSNISKLTNQQNDTYDTSASSLKTKVSLSPNEYMLIADLDLQNLLEKEGSYAFTKYIPIVRRFFSDDSSDYSNKRLLIYLNAVPQKVGDAK